MKDKTLRRVLIFFVVIFGVLGAVAMVAVKNIGRAVEASDWVNHTHAVMAEADGVLSSQRLGEGALRTFLMTGDPRDRAAAREAFDGMTEHLEIAKALTRREEAIHAQFVELERLANERLAFSERAQDARAAGETAVWQALLAEDAGSNAMGEIERGVEKIRTEQMALLAARDRASYHQAQTTRWVVGTGVGLNLVLFVAVTWLIRDDLAARRRAAAVLQEANEQLEAKVRERTSELAATNESLATENLERRWSIQALEHQLRYNQLIVNSVDDLVFVLTKALTITRINPAVTQVTGLRSEDLLGQPVSRVVRLASEPAGDGAAASPLLLQALREGRDLRDLEAVAGGGRTVPARLALYPLRDRDKVVGGILILTTAAPAT